MDSSFPSHCFVSSPSFQFVGGPRKPRRGFTIVELLVVISIVALLVAILLPALEQARAHARVVVCGSNQSQVFVAARAYGTDFGEYPMRITEQHKEEYGNSCPQGEVGGGSAAGRWAMKKLVDKQYLQDEEGAQGTSDRPQGGNWTWGHRFNEPWYEFNGPFANGSHVSSEGHSNGMNALGKTWHRNTWCQAPWGVDFNFRNYHEPRGGTRYAEAEIALIGCPSILDDAGSYSNTCTYEPHLNQPRSGCGYGHQNSGGTAYRRNYTFADGHTQFLNLDTRKTWDWVP